MSLRSLLRRLSIQSQLRLGPGVILFLVLLLGALSWRQANVLWSQTQGLYDHPLLVRRAVGEIKADILAMHRGLKDAVLAENDEEMSQALQAIDRYEGDAHRQFQVVYDRYLGPRSDIVAAEAAFVEWKAIREETIRLLREGETVEAASRTKPNAPGGRHVDLTLAYLQTVSDFAVARGDEFYATAQRERNILRLQLVSVLAGVLLLVAVVSSRLQRVVLRPLRELTAVTNEYRLGRVDARSHKAANSSNEFGTLAVAFNALADTIEAEMRSRARAANLADVMLREGELAGFCRAILVALMEHTGSKIGAVYLLNEAKSAYEHFSSIGLDSGARDAFDAAAPEGEFGSALATRQIQVITEIPAETRFTFTAVSGDFRPAAILTIPILDGPEVMALISLASLHGYSDAALRLVHDVDGVLTARMNGVLAFRQIRAFSEQLASQNAELTAQTQELARQADELGAQNIELELQKQQLHEANRLKSVFLSNMSHELRTPLNSVIALAGVLGRRLNHAIPEEEYGYLEVIERNGKHLLVLINDILDLSRIEAGRADLTITAFSVRDLVTEVMAMLEPQARERGLDLRNEVGSDLPMIRSDLSKCRHVLQNLLGNAVKFTESGHVTVSAAVGEGMVKITVRDSGIGIAADHLPYIFDEFRQADESTSRKYGGTGLGLAIARKYAALLRGSLTVESALGHGSTFTLTLPQAIDATDAGLSGGSRFALSQNWHGAPQPAGRGQRILLVEDSEPAIVQITDILVEHGYRVQVARDGREALAQISQTPPDAVILDLMMPEVDGFEVLQAIREVATTEELPVLILTAKHVTPEELSFLKGNHIQELIQKGDISKAELLAVVGKLVAPVEPVAEETAAVMTRARVGRSGGKPVILVVEDNPDNLQTARAVLGDAYVVIEATDGQAAMAQARVHHPDLILMDIAMPVMDGIQALAAIRDDDALRDIPVIALTASAMKGDRESILAHGFDGYLSKPIEGELLMKAVREVLNVDHPSEDTGD